MTDEPKFSVESAQQAAAENDLDTWVADFLASPGSDNAELAELLSDRLNSWTGPIELPLGQLHRLAGPPEEPVLCPVDDDFWDDRVDDMAERIDEEGWEPAPLVVSYRRDKDQLVVEDGNHRAESLRRAGRKTAWVVVGFESGEDHAAFAARKTA